MNKQLTKKLIGIAASAALVTSVALSSSAIAGPGGGDGGGNGKGDRPKGPKLSLQIDNLCTLDASNPNAPILNVSATIDDVSDDNGTGGGVIMSRTAQAAKKIKGRTFDPIGSAQDLVQNGDVWEASIDLCAADPTIGDAKAVTALVVVDVLNGDDSVTTWASQCDNPFLPGDDLDGDGTDDIDQSDISIGHLGISC